MAKVAGYLLPLGQGVGEGRRWIRYRGPLFGATPPHVVSVTLPDADSHDQVEQRRVTVEVNVTDTNGKVGRDRHVITVVP